MDFTLHMSNVLVVCVWIWTWVWVCLWGMGIPIYMVKFMGMDTHMHKCMSVMHVYAIFHWQ